MGELFYAARRRRYSTMGCIASVGICNPFCNLTNDIGTEWATKNRMVLSIINTILLVFGVCFAVVGAIGAFSDEDLIKSFPWMTFHQSNYTAEGVDAAGVTIYQAHVNDDGILFYSNIWGITDEYKTAHLAWREWNGEGKVCADAHLTVLTCMGIGLFFAILSLLQALNRMDADWDTNGNKCMMLFTTFSAMVSNSIAVGVFSSDCYAAAYKYDMHPKMGIGYYSFIVCILAANVPNFIINLVIKVPSHSEGGEAKPLLSEEAKSPETTSPPKVKSPQKAGRKKGKKPKNAKEVASPAQP